MQTPEAANSHYVLQQKIAVTTTAAVNKLWSQMGENFDPSWQAIRPEMLQLVTNGRLAAVNTSIEYVPQVTAEIGLAAPAAGAIIADRFIEFAPDGRPLGTLLDSAVIQAKTAVAVGATTQEALQRGGKWLTGTMLTVMSDTSRQVVAADIAHRRKIGGYVRMLNTPSCARCVILAGKWFRWNQGFQRHPRCDCRHIPANEDMAGDLRTDPYAFFNSLSPDAQTKLFGRIEARAIREGGDIYRVMNTKVRGLGSARGAAKYGTPTRMTVDDIFRVAGNRTNAIRLMEQEGYITGPQVRGGNILGRFFEGAGQLGKGGVAKAATDAVIQSRITGIRDPLNRYTMTAAERRLYDAKYKYDQARSGIYPRSVGMNSADLYSGSRSPTPEELASFQRAYEREVAKLPTAPASVRTLARALGIL